MKKQRVFEPELKKQIVRLYFHYPNNLLLHSDQGNRYGAFTEYLVG